MNGKMKAVKVRSTWDARPDYRAGRRDIRGELSDKGNYVWRNPKISIEDVDIPKLQLDEVLIEVKACGICGTDVRLVQRDGRGYQLYPVLSSSNLTIGHEFSGVVIEAGPNAINKKRNKIFEPGEFVYSEMNLWCGICQPCCDGYPMHCENLQILGITIDGAMAKYIKVNAKYCWSIESFREVYDEDKLFLAGSVIEPASVAYTATIERGGGIRAGDFVAILGGNPNAIAAVALLKKSGAAIVIFSDSSEKKCKIAQELGADYIINPLKDCFTEKVLKYTNGYGAKLYLEATGTPDKAFPDIEETIRWGKQLNSIVILLAIVDSPIPINGPTYQMKRASIVGTLGNAGHGIAPRVINLMVDGMDITKIITKTIHIDEVPKCVVDLQTNKDDCKITATVFD